MTPDQILATLATYDGLPREAMKAAREHRDEMLPRFLAHIERLATATVDTVTDVDKDACLFVFHLLGEWRDLTHTGRLPDCCAWTLSCSTSFSATA